MNINVREDLYEVRDILQENFTDFDIQRQRPLVFKAGKEYLVCAPVQWKRHPAFIQDLSRIIAFHLEIFEKVEFLTSVEVQNKDAIGKAITQITIFNGSRQYERFVKNDLPSFIRKWAFTLNRKNEKIIPLSRRKAGKILSSFLVDELLEVFFAIFVFNYDVVKKDLQFSLKTKDRPLSDYDIFSFFYRHQPGITDAEIFSKSIQQVRLAITRAAEQAELDYRDIKKITEE